MQHANMEPVVSVLMKQLCSSLQGSPWPEMNTKHSSLMPSFRSPKPFKAKPKAGAQEPGGRRSCGKQGQEHPGDHNDHDDPGG